tara:strand:+ start:1237 stop:1410 length:174 start_codon:yes stop_codon:yes gene_type:complete
MTKFSSPFMAKSPLNEEQSLQTKLRKLKYKVGKGIRNFLGVKEPKVKKPSEYKSLKK